MPRWSPLSPLSDVERKKETIIVGDSRVCSGGVSSRVLEPLALSRLSTPPWPLLDFTAINHEVESRGCTLERDLPLTTRMHHTAPWYLPWGLKLVPLPIPPGHPASGIPNPAGLHLLAPLPGIYAPEPRKVGDDDPRVYHRGKARSHEATALFAFSHGMLRNSIVK